MGVTPLVRILFFLEPVVFQSNPHFLEAHFMWVNAVYAACQHAGYAFVLAANAEVCGTWQSLAAPDDAARECSEIDSFAPLQPFGYNRAAYAKALYGSGLRPSQLVDALIAVRQKYVPDLVVMTSQNAFVRHAFEGISILSLEQAPLPRFGHPVRTAFDPCGHQTNSLLDTFSSRIRSLPLTVNDRRALSNLLAEIKENLLRSDRRAVDAIEALTKIRLEGPVALLVTQPPDWVTYEGAGEHIALEGLICAWMATLPAGWIGVPTYHMGFRLSNAVEESISRHCPQLRFLPNACAQGFTEPLLLAADGMITLSSTSAITGLLFQKRVVVTGASPFNSWTESHPSLIAIAPILTDDEVLSMLGFLTNRFIYRQESLIKSPELVSNIIDAGISARGNVDWLFDMNAWSIEKARSLFSFPDATL